MKYQIQESSLL